MGCTVKELLSRIDSKELGEWMAFDNIEPFGDIRADYRQAITSAIIANANRPKGKAPYKLKEFLPVRQPAKPQSLEEMKLILKSFSK